MKEKQHITTFYLETLLMMVVFVSIIMVLTRVFGGASVRSMQAKHLTNAVTLAQNTAEAVSASGSPRELCSILGEDNNAVISENDKSGEVRVIAFYDDQMQPVRFSGDDAAAAALSGSADSGLVVETVWEQPEDSSDSGALAHVRISVYRGAEGKAVYSLETAVLTKN